MIDVTNYAREALTAECTSLRFNFWWESSNIQVQLPAQSPVRTISVQECASSSKFRFPPSAQLCSKVYELVSTCTHDTTTSSSLASSSAVITLPTFQRRGDLASELGVFLAARTPSYWECDLTPAYAFKAVTGDSVFDSKQPLVRVTVPAFNCFICVLFSPTN